MANVRSLTISLNNSSDADIPINLCSLTGGSWGSSGAPIPGNVISAGATNFENDGDSSFVQLGGSITLGPASGGQIVITWSWPRGSGATGTVTSSSLSGLGVAYTFINLQSMHPTLQVVVTDSASVQSMAH